jgi:hypothetical protein
MVSFIFRSFTLAFLAVIGVVGLLFYDLQTGQQKRIVELEAERFRLEEIVERLAIERRVAEVVVTDQQVREGRLHSRLLLVERDRNGKPMTPRAVDVVGEQVHIDALVIRFPVEATRANDPLRGHAILLLDKIYGDAQPPADAQRIDVVGRVPQVYREASPRVSEFEQRLWTKFWSLATDESQRRAEGVDVAHGVGVFQKLRVDRKYTITLRPDGNVTLRDEAVPELFRRALQPGRP